MEISYYTVCFLFIISAFCLHGTTQANFNMQTSKKYDHYFLKLYHTAFANHLIELQKNQNLELNLENYVKEKQSRGIVKEWFKFDNWKDQCFKQLHQHFLFAVRVAKESTDPFQLLIFMYVKQQAYLRSIVYMNGAIIFPGKDKRKKYCRAIAMNLLNFSDVGTNDIFEKLQTALQKTYGNVLTNKIITTLKMWATAAHMIWEKFVPQMNLDNPSKNIGELYNKLCADVNEIMNETRIAMMLLFEGIKQSVVKPSLPPKERLTLNFAAALNFWDLSETTWNDHFEISKDKFQVIEMITQYDKAEMRMYGELFRKELDFDDLKNLNSLVFDEISGIIKLAMIPKDSGIIKQNKEEVSRRMKANWFIGKPQANFNMIASKRYDHYFLNFYETEFIHHLNDICINQKLELNLENYVKQKQSRGIVRDWFKFDNWKPLYYKHLRRHFLFAVRVAKESTDPFQLLMFMYVKYKAFLQAITYMHGAIIFPEKDSRKAFCRAIAINLLNFCDVGANDIFEKLKVVLQMTNGNVLTNEITGTLKWWTTTAYIVWAKFVPQMKSDNSSANEGELYQKLCAEVNEIMMEARIAMMSLFEGIKQGVVEPRLPPKERLTLNFAAALNFWDLSQTTWTDYFEIATDKFQLNEMMIQYDKAEMRLYGELNDVNKEALNSDNLKNLNLLVFDTTTGIIKLAFRHESVNQEELLRKRNGKQVMEE